MKTIETIKPAEKIIRQAYDVLFKADLTRNQETLVDAVKRLTDEYLKLQEKPAIKGLEIVEAEEDSDSSLELGFIAIAELFFGQHGTQKMIESGKIVDMVKIMKQKIAILDSTFVQILSVITQKSLELKGKLIEGEGGDDGDNEND